MSHELSGGLEEVQALYQRLTNETAVQWSITHHLPSSEPQECFTQWADQTQSLKGTF